MKAFWAIPFLVCLTAVSTAQSVSEYIKMRKKMGISQAVGVEALETLIGTRTVEIQGRVKGYVSVGEGTALLLEKSDGDTMFVTSPKPPADWLAGNEVAVRLLVKAYREAEGMELKASLVGAAPESSIGVLEHKASRPTKLSSRKGARSKGAAKATRNWNLPASEATPIYAAFIKQRNRRLSDAQATQIAQGVIGFSLKYGVDARLIMAMIMVESGFNPGATSRAGAMGLGQLMPGTARGMGVSNAYDTMENLYGTVRLIRGHLEKYSSRNDSFSALALSLAAYNAGGGAVRKYGGIPPYRETQNYVKKVTSIYRALCGA